jgi:hypothetical protein
MPSMMPWRVTRRKRWNRTQILVTPQVWRLEFIYIYLGSMLKQTIDDQVFQLVFYSRFKVHLCTSYLIMLIYYKLNDTYLYYINYNIIKYMCMYISLLNYYIVISKNDYKLENVLPYKSVRLNLNKTISKTSNISFLNKMVFPLQASIL